MKNIIHYFIEYVRHNNLEIDKSTFFTVIIAEITIYGILLTFYQFVATFQGEKNSVTKYLGVNVVEYVVQKDISTFGKIISNRCFNILCMLQILYKPFITIYKKSISQNFICVMNFFWYTFTILYFIIFIFLFVKCAKSILSLKFYSDSKTNGRVIDDINKTFMKKNFSERSKKSLIDLLIDDMHNLKFAISSDNNSELQMRYNCLINKIFIEYIRKKKKYIWQLKEKKDVLKKKKHGGIILKLNAIY